MNYKKLFNIPLIDIVAYNKNIFNHMLLKNGNYFYDINYGYIDYRELGTYSYKELKKIICLVFGFQKWQVRIKNGYLYICFFNFKYKDKMLSYFVNDFLKSKNYKVIEMQLNENLIILKCKNIKEIFSLKNLIENN